MSGANGGIEDADVAGGGVGGGERWVAGAARRWGGGVGGGGGGGGGGDGRRGIAGRAGRAASTVRGWLRRFAGRAEEVRVFFTVLLARTGPDPVMPACVAGPVAAAVSAITGAAVAVT